MVLNLWRKVIGFVAINVMSGATQYGLVRWCLSLKWKLSLTNLVHSSDTQFDTDAFRNTCLESLYVRRHLLVGCVRRNLHAFLLDHSLVTQMLQEFSHPCREGKVGCLPFVTWRYIPIRQRGRQCICQVGRCARRSVMGVCCDVRTSLLRVVSLGMMNGSVRRAVSCELVNQPDMCDRLPWSPSGRRNSLPRASGLFTFTFLIGTTAWWGDTHLYVKCCETVCFTYFYRRSMHVE